MHIRNIRRSIYLAFKAYCAKRGVNMNMGLEHIMRKTLQSGGSVGARPLTQRQKDQVRRRKLRAKRRVAKLVAKRKEK